MKQLHAMIVLAAMLLPTLTDAKDAVVTTPPIGVQVQVDAQGHLGAITPMQKLDEPYASLVQRTLAGWSFYPARIGGKPVVTTTWLSVELEALPRDNGQFDVHVAYLGNGPYADSLMPKYPADMMRVACEAKIVVLATIGMDGKFSDVRIVQALTTNGMPAKKFVTSALDSLRRASVKPIIVDGEPVISQVSVPITFGLSANVSVGTLMPAEDSARLVSVDKDMTAADEKVEAPENAIVALDSPVSPRALPGS